LQVTPKDLYGVLLYAIVCGGVSQESKRLQVHVHSLAVLSSEGPELYLFGVKPFVFGH